MTNSSRPSASTGRSILHSLHAYSSIVILRTETFVCRFVPNTPTIAAHLDAFRPVGPASIRPTAHLNGTVVDDDVFVDGVIMAEATAMSSIEKPELYMALCLPACG